MPRPPPVRWYPAFFVLLITLLCANLRDSVEFLIVSPESFPVLFQLLGGLTSTGGDLWSLPYLLLTFYSTPSPLMDEPPLHCHDVPLSLLPPNTICPLPLSGGWWFRVASPMMTSAHQRGRGTPLLVVSWLPVFRTPSRSVLYRL